MNFIAAPRFSCVSAQGIYERQLTQWVLLTTGAQMRCNHHDDSSHGRDPDHSRNEKGASHDPEAADCAFD